MYAHEHRQRRHRGKDQLTIMTRTLVRSFLMALAVITAHVEARATAQDKAACSHGCGATDGNCRCGNRGRVKLPYRHCDIPFGASLNAILQVQRNHGTAASTVLYHFDFNADDTLSGGGTRRLARIAGSLQYHPYPIIIQSVANGAAHNAARKKAVLQALKAHSFPVPDERVVTGRPPARGLHGLDAELVHEKMLTLEADTSGGGVSSTTPSR